MGTELFHADGRTDGHDDINNVRNMHGAQFSLSDQPDTLCSVNTTDTQAPAFCRNM